MSAIVIPIVIPIVVFIAALIALLWLERKAYKQLKSRLSTASWPANRILLPAIRIPLALWCLIASAYLALSVSSLPFDWKEPASRALWSVLLLSITFAALYITSNAITFYGRRLRISNRTTTLATNFAAAVIVIISVFVLWEIWGAPGSPLQIAITWLAKNWTSIAIPAAILIAVLIILLRLRRLAYPWMARWLKMTKLEGAQVTIRAIRWHSIIWCFLISAYLALIVSSLSPEWKDPVAKGLWTLLIASVTVAGLYIVSGWLTDYGEKWHLPRDAVAVLRNTTRIVFLIVMVLIIMEMWGLPTSPILLLIVVLALAAAFAFRDVVPNLFAGFQLSATQQIKVGDYIKLETGEEGYVQEISWNNTRIKTPAESIVIIPNSRLIQRPVINYGRPLKRASAPFRFNTRTHLTEMTGLKANNLRELVSILRKSSDPIIYYHTHRFLEQQHYLTPELSNDFAVWVSDALGDEVLGERLASVDTFEFPNLGALRDNLVAIMDAHLDQEPDSRRAMEGREFYFMKTVTVILPTPYIAYDLREFTESLRKISLGSLYFHMFESRLRLGTVSNDFSIWLERSIGDADLGREIARLDPYTYTLEGLRSALIQAIEKRIK